MGDLVQMVYRKYDGRLHWQLSMRRLGEDEHGVWLGLPGGGQMRRGDEPPVTLHQAHVLLVPREQWWTASFNAPPCWTELYCDITTPAGWTGPDEVTAVDLDLDVIRRFDALAAELLDADEFAEHQQHFGYPPDVIGAAERSARWLLDAVVGAEPFLTAYRPWLAEVAG